MVRLRKALLGLFAVATTVDGYWRMSCGLIQMGRVDPIVTPGGVSGHVHKVAGGSNFGLSSTYDEMLTSRCSSCEIQDDKSAYWTPALYYQHGNGTFQPVPNDGMVVYYLGRGVNRSNIEPFPANYRVLSGDNSARSAVSGTTWNGARKLADRVSFACLDSSGPMKERNHMWRTDCDYGLRAQIQFPSCWNGGPYMRDQSHVAYLSQIDNGACPSTHPRPLPHLFFEVLYGVNSIKKTSGGRFVFANGDTTGYSFHGDFMNGWNADTLQEAIKRCINSDRGAGAVSACSVLKQSQDPYTDTNCPQQAPIVDERVTGLLSKLPGCNPVTSGPAAAPQQVCASNPDTTDTVVDEGSTMWNPVKGDMLSTWEYLGCAAEGTTRTLSQYSISSVNMTIDLCTATCQAQDYQLAGLENSRECYCANSLTRGISYKSQSTCASTSKMVCAGNTTQWCGAPSFLTIWNDTSYQAPEALVVGKTNISDGAGTYNGCWTEATSGRALSSDRLVNTTGMTNEMCVEFCQAGGYSYAGTEYSEECYCGNTNTGTRLSDNSQCTMKCKGDLSSYCGAGNRLSVWKVAASTTESEPITALRGAIEYQGCYTDAASVRALSSASYSNTSNTIQMCYRFCKQKGYPVFGMEYGAECYCGQALASTSQKASEGDCRMPCSGNSDQTCGDGYRLSVWALTSDDDEADAVSSTSSSTRTSSRTSTRRTSTTSSSRRSTSTRTTSTRTTSSRTSTRTTSTSTSIRLNNLRVSSSTSRTSTTRTTSRSSTRTTTSTTRTSTSTSRPTSTRTTSTSRTTSSTTRPTSTRPTSSTRSSSTSSSRSSTSSTRSSSSSTRRSSTSSTRGATVAFAAANVESTSTTLTPSTITADQTTTTTISTSSTTGPTSTSSTSSTSSPSSTTTTTTSTPTSSTTSTSGLSSAIPTISMTFTNGTTISTT